MLLTHINVCYWTGRIYVRRSTLSCIISTSISFTYMFTYTLDVSKYVDIMLNMRIKLAFVSKYYCLPWVVNNLAQLMHQFSFLVHKSCWYVLKYYHTWDSHVAGQLPRYHLADNLIRLACTNRCVYMLFVVVRSKME